jgi:hypothetical protein
MDYFQIILIISIYLVTLTGTGMVLWRFLDKKHPSKMSPEELEEWLIYHRTSKDEK